MTCDLYFLKLQNTVFKIFKKGSKSVFDMVCRCAFIIGAITVHAGPDVDGQIEDEHFSHVRAR